jgi:predicted dehydrogenase
MRGSRPGWYFEPGKHGGTINDIGVHGIDMTEWMTGLRFTEINAARTWNAIPKDRAFFNDAGQFMLTMENGCGVLGDVSYFSPDSCGYSLPYYWNFMFWGTKGVIRASPQGDTVELALNGRKNLSHVSRSTQAPCDYLTQFLLDIKGRPGDLNTETVLRASRTALKVQETADKKNPGVRLV